MSKKNWRVLRELFWLRFHGLTVFRFDFFAPFFVDGSLFLIQLLAFGAIYSNVDTIGSWGRGGMILYIGTFSLLNAVNMTVYFFGVTSIPHKVRSGELDLYLTKPVSPLFRLTFERISPGSVPLIVMSVCMISYGTASLDMTLSAARTVSYLFWLMLMEILYYEMEVIIRSVSLYVVSMARMEQLEEAGIQHGARFCRVPAGVKTALDFGCDEHSAACRVLYDSHFMGHPDWQGNELYV